MRYEHVLEGCGLSTNFAVKVKPPRGQATLLNHSLRNKKRKKKKEERMKEKERKKEKERECFSFCHSDGCSAIPS